MNMTEIRLAAFFAKFDLEKVKIGPGWANAEISLKSKDREAAWELYVEMLTRIVTQPLSNWDGDEEKALESVYSLFPITREVLRRQGRGAISFTKIAVPVLNQVVRPFTAKWHKESLAGAFSNDEKCGEFRKELAALQEELRKYNRMLAELANVEDLTDLEQMEGL